MYYLNHQGDNNLWASNNVAIKQQPTIAAKKCYTMLYYTILYYTILYYTILHYTTLLVFLRSVCRLIVIANVVPSSPIFATLMMDVLRSSEALVLTRATRPSISEDGLLHGHRRKNLKSYILYTDWSDWVHWQKRNQRKTNVIISVNEFDSYD
jgi:hypothetical protein